MPPPAPRPLLLFDGTCALCDGTVRWLIRHDRGRLHYAPLQSPVGLAELDRARLEGDTSSVVLLAEHGIYQHSDAAWRVLAELSWPWRAGAFLRFVPRIVRDGLYRFIARNRFRLFGRSDMCQLLTSLSPEQQRRILE